ncbi:MAG: discoidin domain-containing protein [Clostridia bacterium]|nr:discoidin domain-containing protein [Clostridia bacterium]
MKDWKRETNRKAVRMILSLLLCLGTLGTLSGSFPGGLSEAETYDHTVTVSVKGVDCPTTEGNVIVYKAGASAKKLYSKDYHFRTSYLMVFRSDGSLAEIGSNLLEENGVQLSVTVPAGGFMIAFAYSASSDLYSAFTTALEGAMHYNATITAAYPMFGTYDAKNATVTVRYNDPAPVPANAKKFLFVGNSTTYVNGTPLKFRELARAAGVEVDVTYCTEGSAYLEYFADGGKYESRFHAALAKKKYDFVVLQDAAGSDYVHASTALANLIPQIRNNGATPVFYMRYYSDKSSCYELTNKYYTLYERLARENGTIYAPVVVAFLRCQENYPDVNLYADDLSHHSKEGSYLIAATMLYAYLGISPVGNAYTADMDADTVAALQACAASAIENPYKPESAFEDFEEDGKTYTNVALNRPYERTGTPYTQSEGKWIDYDPSTGKLYGKMTDGVLASSGDDLAIAAYKAAEGSPADVIIDLGKTFQLRKFDTDLYGGNWGITDPRLSSISVSVSADGKTYVPVGNLTCSSFKTSGSWISGMFTLHLEEDVSGRYVKFSYHIKGNPNYFCWTSEAAVFGAAEDDVFGDVTGDGFVNAKDYLLLKRTVLGTYTPTEAERGRMDIDGDKIVNAKDYAIVKRVALRTYTGPR